ncbi:hypothetical protein BpHYR1_017536, partial [Brachionus plicatilis]
TCAIALVVSIKLHLLPNICSVLGMLGLFDTVVSDSELSKIMAYKQTDSLDDILFYLFSLRYFSLLIFKTVTIYTVEFNIDSTYQRFCSAFQHYYEIICYDELQSLVIKEYNLYKTFHLTPFLLNSFSFRLIREK